MIEKWFGLGREYVQESPDHKLKIKNAENFIKDLAVKSRMPRVPIFILTSLQLYETGASSNTSGAYGYFFEQLVSSQIDSALDALGNSKTRYIHRSVPDMVLCYIAYDFFKSRNSSVDRTGLERIFDAYRASIGSSFPSEQLLPVLLTSETLREDNGLFRFSHSYIYHYYVAQYLNRHLNKDRSAAEVRSEIGRLIDRLHVDEFSSILIHLVYMTEDEQTIGDLIIRARDLFKGFKPCDIASDVKLFNELTDDFTPMSLEDPMEHLAQLREEGEELERAELASKLDFNEEITDAELDDVLKISVSFKLLQVLGQVLRNSPGSMSIDLKRSATEECYLLALRSLTFVNRLLSDNVEEFHKEYFKRLEVTDKLQIFRKIDGHIFALANLASYAIVRRVCYSIGTLHLKDIFDSLGNLGAPVAVGLINTAITLDHCEGFPESEVDDLRKICFDEKNFLGFNVLRQLVIDHLILVNRGRELKEKICNELLIESNSPALLGRTRRY